MVTLLAKWLIKQSECANDNRVRKAYGFLCGILGVILNLLLFAAKMIAGSISSSISITADAFNNLSDAGSSAITLFGFALAGQKPDSDHPFGHGRFEYISGLIVSLLILLMGFELFQSSVERLFAPEQVSSEPLVLIILAASVLVKLYMWFYNYRIGKRIDSASMRATAVDSLSDMVSTLVVLASSIVNMAFQLNIDAYCGILVSLFILFSGFRSAKETISPLLGQPPKKDFVEQLTKLVTEHEQVLGIHDLIVHDYGPNRLMISLHAEVPAHGDILEMHDLIDNIERDIKERFNCPVTIHMDPIVTDDGETNRVRSRIDALVRDIDPALSIHDFRMVTGPSHTNLIFDLVTPHKFRLSDKELKDKIATAVALLDSNYYTVIEVERAYA
ncbi:MAG: cation diffusion facilitator family transporter [Clostridia bacterium]|nr:cation diffusion facilitator family transporter [Clostridia bacterium]